MRIHSKAIVGAALLGFLVGLSGCGGGGGDGDGGVVIPTSPINITPDNAVQVASVTLGATSILAEFEAEPIIGPASSSVSGATSAEALPPLAEFVSSQFGQLQTLVPQVGYDVTVAVAVPPTTYQCLVSGTLTVSGNIADSTLNTLTPGDVITATYSSCDDGDGLVVSGTFTFSVQGFTGNLVTPPYSVTAMITFTNLALTVQGESLSLNGNMTYIESSQDGVVYTDELKGESLNFSLSTMDTGSWTNFDMISTVDFNTMAYSVDSSGTLATMQLGGSVQSEITTPFEGIGAEYPSTGVMLVTGAANSSETITVVNSIDITIEVDADGNGVTDQRISTTWDAL